jgi:hypothetical protein
MEKKDFEKDGLDNDSIIKIIKNIRDVVDIQCNDSIIEELKKNNSFFAERYPILFDMATRTDEAFNWDYLNYFLTMRTKIITNELTTEKASVIVGKEWYNKHVNINDNNTDDNIIKQNINLTEPPIKFSKKSKKK